MRATETCPKCSGKKFAVTQFRQPNHQYANGLHQVVPVAVTLEKYPYRKTLGILNLWTCLGCGFAELYAFNLDGIEALAQQCPGQVLIVDGRPKEGPYR